LAGDGPPFSLLDSVSIVLDGIVVVVVAAVELEVV
jgi:hypothetical protein